MSGALWDGNLGTWPTTRARTLPRACWPGFASCICSARSGRPASITCPAMRRMRRSGHPAWVLRTTGHATFGVGPHGTTCDSLRLSPRLPRWSSLSECPTPDPWPLPRSHTMSQTRIETLSHRASRPRIVGSAVRTLTLGLATLATGLVAGVFYAYAVSVNLGLAAQPDASYVATMNAINERIENPVFFLNFFGAVLFLIAALVVYSPRPRSGRFWLIALACLLYIVGCFLLTVFVNVPLNEELARVAADASSDELSGARAAYEDPWNFWNGVRTVFSSMAFLALIGACLLREDRSAS